MDASPTPRKSLLRFAPFVLIVAALVLALVFRVHERLSLDTLYAQSQALDAFVANNLLAALALFAALYAIVTLISLPGAGVLSISGGFLFGPWLGATGAWTGAMIGATLLFLATSTAFGDMLRGKTSGWLEKLRDGFAKDAFNYLLVLRLTPVAPFFVVNLAPGFLGVSLRDFVLATAIGIIPGCLVYASVGSGLKAALQTGAASDPDQAIAAILSSPAVYLPILALIALALLPLALRALRGSRAERAA